MKRGPGRPFPPGHQGHRHWRVCGARRRGTDQTCRALAMKGWLRCRIHGGATESGRQPGNRSAFKHGRRSQEGVAARKAVVVTLRLARAVIRTGLTIRSDDGPPEPKTAPRCCQL
jgi:hypothetical protein